MVSEQIMSAVIARAVAEATRIVKLWQRLGQRGHQVHHDSK